MQTSENVKHEMFKVDYSKPEFQLSTFSSWEEIGAYNAKYRIVLPVNQKENMNLAMNLGVKNDDIKITIYFPCTSDYLKPEQEVFADKILRLLNDLL